MLHFYAMTDGTMEHDGPNKQYIPTIVFISVCKHKKGIYSLKEHQLS